MIKKIVTIPNNILRLKSKRIGYVDDSIRKLAEDMIDTTLDWDRDSELGAALAAIQVGEPLKLTVVRNNFEDNNDQSFTTLINPEITKASPEMVSDIEGCLSIPGIYGTVLRHQKIKVKAVDSQNHPIRLTLEGFPARVLQHEIDHMSGTIFLDHISSTDQMYHLAANGKLKPLKPAEKTKLSNAKLKAKE